MRCPTLHELPPPPQGRTGWPWTEESQPLPDTMSDGRPWPRISIVTPSYNQAPFIEETIRSVLLQGYPNLEYIVMDGGSTDSTLEIIHKYASGLMYWQSQPDSGQADALRSGFMKASGTLLGWLNSDDYYLPGTLATVVQAHSLYPSALIAGSVIDFDMHSGAERLVLQRGLSPEQFLKLWERACSWHQPGIFFPRSAYQLVGGLNPSLHYAMDYDLLCRLLRLNTPVVYLDQPLARFRRHSASKTQAENTRLALEVYATAARYWRYLPNCSLTGGSARMLWHMMQRSIKHLVRGDGVTAWNTLVGSGALAARLMRDALTSSRKYSDENSLSTCHSERSEESLRCYTEHDVTQANALTRDGLIACVPSDLPNRYRDSSR